LNPRDLVTLLVIGAVVVIGGFAAADAIRGKPGAERPAAPTIPVQTSPSRLPGPQPRAEAPANWPQGLLQGTITFADAQSCAIRVIALAGGRERPVAHFGSDCFLWAPPVGSRLAYGLGPSSADGLHPFRIADLANPDLELGGYRALFGVVLWSPDGQRVAWCGRNRTGYDMEIGGPARRLPQCPVAYSEDGEIAYAVGDRVLVEGRTVLRADGGVTYAHFGDDGSLVIVVDGKRIERLPASGAPIEVALPPALEGKTPILRSDNCGALFRTENDGIRLLDLGCRRGLSNRSFIGEDAAWSPDGSWVALAQGNRIAFDRVVGPRLQVEWPARAFRLAWRPT
jgi:WD40-like Beta Propeller Repeat